MKKEQSDFAMEQIFTQEEKLPDIVLRKKEEAFDAILSMTDERQNAKAQHREPAHRSRSGLMIPRAAGIILACLIAAGGTAAAAAGILTRRDRLKAMDDTELSEFAHDMEMSGWLIYEESRDFSEEEKLRYLNLKAAYDKNERFPESEITRLQEGETYPGTGVCLMLTAAGEENILRLPDGELTDEDLLEIIEYGYKSMYAFYENRKTQDIEKGNWESRVAALTDEEVDYYYLAFCSGHLEISDGFVRGDSGYDTPCLTEAEDARYLALKTAYEEENLFPEGALSLIELPEEYDGASVVVCRYDGMFYLPEREVTDEEMLEIIDFRAKADAALNRINYEISMGYRSAYPKLPNN